MSASIDGLVSGLNTTQIISQLMQVERLPEQQLTTQQQTRQTLIGILQGFNSKLSSLTTLASALVPDTITKSSIWQAALATSSDTTRVTAVAGSGAPAGAVSFTVTSLATAGAAVSSGTVSATTTPVAANPILVSKGAAALGFSDLQAGAALTTGTPHSITVTQSSSAAILTANSPLQGSITIDSTNNTFSYYLNGTTPPKSITLTSSAPGTSYTPAQLAAELQRASGGDLKATVDSTGTLSVSTAHEGSANSLRFAAGTANTVLGITDTTTLATGTDGIISVDTVSHTFTDLYAGQQLTLGGNGTDQILGTLAGSGLRAGAATATSVVVAPNATLADVVTAINGSKAGVSATAVGVSSSAYKLQLTSTSTGSASDITLNSNAFLPNTLGAMQQLSAGTDTVLHVGSGAGAYDVTSSTTTVSGLLQGVSITALKADPGTTVTVSVAKDSGGMADKIQAMVDQANAVLSFVSDNSSYNATTKVGGPLMGDSLSQNIARRVTDAVIGTSTSTPSMAGVTVDRDGKVLFDRQKFLDAYAKDPNTVQTTMTALGQQIADAATQASDPVTGLVTERIKNEQDTITDLSKQIADFEERMTLRQQSLQQTYANLETALGQLQSQSQWLGGQLAQLPTPSIGK